MRPGASPAGAQVGLPCLEPHMTDVKNVQKEPSINDSLPNNNPSLKTVLLVLGGVVVVVGLFIMLAGMNL
jgi:hypothetical protein